VVLEQVDGVGPRLPAERDTDHRVGCGHPIGVLCPDEARRVEAGDRVPPGRSRDDQLPRHLEALEREAVQRLTLFGGREQERQRAEQGDP
jgi:hypothetical protein